jgi:midasin (ATPase involved in ribosome maturation)
MELLSLLGIGEKCLSKFGSEFGVVHHFGEQCNDESVGSTVSSFTFDEQVTNIVLLLDGALSYFRQTNNVCDWRWIF